MASPVPDVTALMLAAAWYLTYRRPKADHCSTGGCPKNPVAKRNKIILWLATALVIANRRVSTFSGAAARLFVLAGASDSGSSQVKLSRLQVTIPSMDCGACAVGMQAKLNRQDGVQAAQVDFATKTAVIRLDPGKLSPGKITASIDETGFKAQRTTFSQER